ncbi:uncharacterized protein LOC132545251 [Ylistrum balloti]|uniref:uncharacterized protein LOC132545251 n=1 Tax=Ylistrum balloti TaxID=509963 RepID=UPI0029059D39|nr:uncharacterized protein LOC132545251 [Ylistrum balloti]
MTDFRRIFIIIRMLMCLKSCQAALQLPPIVTAYYVADGTIRVSWSPPNTTLEIENYYIKVLETGIYTYKSPNSRNFRYKNPTPDSKYTFQVSTVISNTIRGSTITSVNTPAAKYIPKGDKASLSLPVRTSAIQTVLFNGLVLASIKNGVIRRRPPKDITVKVTADAIELNIKKVAKSNAGYYFIGSFSRELTGEMLFPYVYNVYTCVATEKGKDACRSSSDESDGFQLNPYRPSVISGLSYLDSGRYNLVRTGFIWYTERSSLVLIADIDTNPDAEVALLRNKTTVATGVKTSFGKYAVVLKKLQCNHTGMYHVRASNAMTKTQRNTEPSLRQFELQVKCSPRRENGKNRVIEVTGETGQTTLLNVSVIANPMPTVEWSADVTSLPILRDNKYMFTLRGEVMVNETSDFRKFHVNVTNEAGGLLIVTFKIRSEVPVMPTKPTKTLPWIKIVIPVTVVAVVLLVALVIIIVVRIRRRRQKLQRQSHTYGNVTPEGYELPTNYTNRSSDTSHQRESDNFLSDAAQNDDITLDSNNVYENFKRPRCGAAQRDARVRDSNHVYETISERRFVRLM